MFTRTIHLPSFLFVEHRLERPLINLLFVMICLLIAGYVYGIAATTFHIIARKDAHRSVAATQSRIAQLGLEYYSLSDAITPERGTELGMISGGSASVSYATHASRLVLVGGGSR